MDSKTLTIVTMKSSEILIQKIKEFEGLRLKSYKDSAGVWTIGYGHTRGVKSGQVITEKQAESLLRGDLLGSEKYVNGLGLSFSQGQFDALVDFVYNLGTGSLGRSTLLKKYVRKLLRLKFKMNSKGGFTPAVKNYRDL